MGVTFKLCMPDKYYVLNINRKPWSNYRMATLLPVCVAPLAAEIDKRPLLTSQKTPITNERYTVD
jgi:hypothetical protein